MNHKHKLFGILTLVLAIASFGAAPVQAQSDVRMQISTQETYVGMGVTLLIQVEDADTSQPPELPEINGLDIRSGGTPSRSSNISIINGRRSESSSVTYRILMTPRREGTFEVPSFTVTTADGPRRTQPFRFSATTGETGDLMFAEVAGQKEKLFVGQPINLTLRIWLKPYRDKKLDMTISAADMWRMIVGQSEWGPFAETLEEMAAEGKTLRGREVLRADSDGVERSYYLYEIESTFYPKRAGQIDIGDVQVVAQYPTSLGKSRDPFESFFGDSPFGRGMLDDDFFKNRGFSPFGRSLTVTSARPIVVAPEVAPIDVTPIPTVGRPADYRGAVGQYQMITRATSNKVKAGDPITLTMGIRGTGPMELVQSPPLAEIDSLTADFKVSDEPLAGVVRDDIKVFSTTIRPRREGITQVPSIPFSFFDSEKEEFVTVYSDPIAIQVDKAEKLALDSIVGSGGGRKQRSTQAESSSKGPVFENYAGSDVLASQNMSANPRFWFGLFFAPTALLGLFLLFRNRERLIPQKGKRSGAMIRINRATDSRDVAKSILTMIAHNFGRQANLTRSEAVALISGEADSTTVRQLEEFLAECENAAFAGDAAIPLTQSKQKARSLVAKLTQIRPNKSVLSLQPKVQRPWRILPTTALALTVIAVTAYPLFVVFSSPDSQADMAMTGASPVIELNEAQRETLLSEATVEYNHAVEAESQDAAIAKDSFATAAQKYQTLVYAGVHNSRLYFNLGNAYLQSDSVGRAIANYRRVLKLRPFDSDVRRNLDVAMAAAGQSDTNETSSMLLDPDQLSSWVASLPARIWLSVLAIGWIGICSTLLIKTLQPPFRVRYMAIPAMILIFAASGLTIYSANVEEPLPAAVVVASDIPVYEGSSEAFPELSNIKITEGDSVEVIQRRGDWLQIRSSTGEQGWTKSELVEQV